MRVLSSYSKILILDLEENNRMVAKCLINKIKPSGFRMQLYEPQKFCKKVNFK